MRIAITRPLLTPESQAYGSASGDRIALMDSEGNIVGVNDGWLATACRLGAEINPIEPAATYLDLCRWASFSSADAAREALSGIRAVLERKLPSFAMEYSGDSPSEMRHFRMGVTPMRYERAQFAIIHT